MVHSSATLTNTGCSTSLYPKTSDGNFILATDPDMTWTWAISSEINADVSNALGGNLKFDYLDGDLKKIKTTFTDNLRVVLIGEDANVTATFAQQMGKY